MYRERRELLPDGTALVIRRIGSQDAPELAEAFAGLSEESRRLRFLSAKPTLSASELRYFTEVDGQNHEALVAIDLDTGHGVGITRFVRDRADPSRAEVAVTVADQWQHRGVATLLLRLLTDRAREEGIGRYTALISFENVPMRHLLDHLGQPLLVSGGGSAAEYEVELARAGLGEQLSKALREVAAGHLAPPPPLARLLRAIVPIVRLPGHGIGARRASEPAPEEPGAPESPEKA